MDQHITKKRKTLQKEFNAIETKGFHQIIVEPILQNILLFVENIGEIYQNRRVSKRFRATIDSEEFNSKLFSFLFQNPNSIQMTPNDDLSCYGLKQHIHHWNFGFLQFDDEETLEEIPPLSVIPRGICSDVLKLRFWLNVNLLKRTKSNFEDETEEKKQSRNDISSSEGNYITSLRVKPGWDFMWQDLLIAGDGDPPEEDAMETLLDSVILEKDEDKDDSLDISTVAFEDSWASFCDEDMEESDKERWRQFKNTMMKALQMGLFVRLEAFEMDYVSDNMWHFLYGVSPMGSIAGVWVFMQF